MRLHIFALKVCISISCLCISYLLINMNEQTHNNNYDKKNAVFFYVSIFLFGWSLILAVVSCCIIVRVCVCDITSILLPVLVLGFCNQIFFMAFSIVSYIKR